MRSEKREKGGRRAREVGNRGRSGREKDSGRVKVGKGRSMSAEKSNGRGKRRGNEEKKQADPNTLTRAPRVMKER